MVEDFIIEWIHGEDSVDPDIYLERARMAREALEQIGDKTATTFMIKNYKDLPDDSVLGVSTVEIIRGCFSYKDFFKAKKKNSYSEKKADGFKRHIKMLAKMSFKCFEITGDIDLYDLNCLEITRHLNVLSFFYGTVVGRNKLGVDLTR